MLRTPAKYPSFCFYLVLSTRGVAATTAAACFCFCFCFFRVCGLIRLFFSKINSPKKKSCFATYHEPMIWSRHSLTMYAGNMVKWINAWGDVSISVVCLAFVALAPSVVENSTTALLSHFLVAYRAMKKRGNRMSFASRPVACFKHASMGNIYVCFGVRVKFAF